MTYMGKTEVFPSFGSFPKGLQQPRLGQAQVRNQFPSWSPTRWQGPKCWGSGQQQGVGSEAEQLSLSSWDVSVENNGLTQCVTTLALTNFSNCLVLHASACLLYCSFKCAIKYIQHLNIYIHIILLLLYCIILYNRILYCITVNSKNKIQEFFNITQCLPLIH